MNDTHKTRILTILEPLRSADPVFASLYVFVSDVPDIPKELIQVIDELIAGILENLRNRLDAESFREVEDARANIRTLIDADREASQAEATRISQEVYF
ncbi:MAG TPA: hypothetical protein PK765_06430 [bacterium]|nr:hypothetical protein [bacterium]